jgi:uncharacterized membrane protein
MPMVFGAMAEVQDSGEESTISLCASHRRDALQTCDAAHRRSRRTTDWRHHAESSWILGRLYFNRSDPTLFIERRMGLGYTLNLGNPWSWVVMIVFVTGIAIPLVLVP